MKGDCYCVFNHIPICVVSVMGWIKADKSVIICAPTSSGKTVLSSIVALIGKNKTKVVGTADQKVRRGQEALKGAKDEDEISGDEDDEEGDEDDEGEGDEGDEEDGEEGDEEDTNIEVDVRGMTINKEGKTSGSEGKEREKERGIDSKCAGFDFAFQDRLARMNFRYCMGGENFYETVLNIVVVH